MALPIVPILLMAGGAMMLLSRKRIGEGGQLLLSARPKIDPPLLLSSIAAQPGTIPKPTRVPPPPRPPTPDGNARPFDEIYSGAGLRGNPGKGNWHSLRGNWLDLNSPGVWTDLEKMHKIWGDPPSLNVTEFLGMKEAEQVLAWIAGAPEDWQWGYGNAKADSARVDPLTNIIGRGAGKPEEALSDAMGLVGGLINVALGASSMVVTGGTAGKGALGKGIKEVLEGLSSLFGGISKRSRDRKMIANGLMGPIVNEYVANLALWNPHIVHNGQIVLSPAYKRNPQTAGELYPKNAAGSSRPLVYIPGWIDNHTPLGMQ
jgi:hypothetical protein